MNRFITLTITLLLSLSGFAKKYTIENIPMVHLQDETRYVCNPDNVLDWSAVAKMDAQLTELNKGLSSAWAFTASMLWGHTLMSLKASHVREFDLPDPAECCMRYVLPTPTSATSRSSRVTASSWW